jgi:hypothetical protein
MHPRLYLALLAASVMANSALGRDPSPEPAESTVPAFALKDQYGDPHQYRFPRESPGVIVFADRKGSSQLEAWIQGLHQRYESAIEIHGVAKLKGVPAFMRGMLRTIFRNNLDYPVMIDWTGKVSDLYDYPGEVAMLCVVDPQGREQFRVKGPRDPEDWAACCARIDALLQAAGVPEADAPATVAE